MKVRGAVERGVFARGSKSEREAPLLVVGGRRLLLRRMGGEPYGDPALDALVGRRIAADGQIHNGVLLLTAWRDLGPADAHDDGNGQTEDS